MTSIVFFASELAAVCGRNPYVSASDAIAKVRLRHCGCKTESRCREDLILAATQDAVLNATQDAILQATRAAARHSSDQQTVASVAHTSAENIVGTVAKQLETFASADNPLDAECIAELANVVPAVASVVAEVARKVSSTAGTQVARPTISAGNTPISGIADTCVSGIADVTSVSSNSASANTSVRDTACAMVRTIATKASVQARSQTTSLAYKSVGTVLEDAARFQDSGTRRVRVDSDVGPLRRYKRFATIARLCGRPDGIVRNASGQIVDLVEYKQRMNRLFGSVPLYEQIQLHAYMFLCDLTQATLCETFNGTQAIHVIKFDPTLWDNVVCELERVALAIIADQEL